MACKCMNPACVFRSCCSFLVVREGRTIPDSFNLSIFPPRSLNIRDSRFRGTGSGEICLRRPTPDESLLWPSISLCLFYSRTGCPARTADRRNGGGSRKANARLGKDLRDGATSEYDSPAGGRNLAKSLVYVARRPPNVRPTRRTEIRRHLLHDCPARRASAVHSTVSDGRTCDAKYIGPPAGVVG